MASRETGQNSANNNPVSGEDMCRVRETVMMLNLAVARIEHAMCEGDDSISTLTDSFTTLAESARNINQSAQNLPECDEKAVILHNGKNVSTKVTAAIMAFQFYDRLSQRLHHVSNSLNAMTALIDDDCRLSKPEEWRQLQETIRAKYTLDDDKKMFDQLMQGMTVAEVLKQANESGPADDDIELF